MLAGVVAKLDVAVEMSGGIRDDESLERALATGCRRVIIGTAALEQPDWVAKIIAEHGDKIFVGLDVRGTRLAARGWTKLGGELLDVLARLEADGCQGYVVTDVNKDGMLSGPNLDLLKQVCALTERPVIASGGVSSLDDLRAIATLVPTGVTGAIVGKALYARVFTLEEALRGGARGDSASGLTVAVRVIPCLDVDAGRVVKGVNFRELRDAGDPVELAAAYDADGADELVFLDITASSDHRETLYEVLERTADQVFIPLTVGGGVRVGDRYRPAAAGRRGQGRDQHRRDREARADQRGQRPVRRSVHRRVGRCQTHRSRRAGSNSRSPPTAGAAAPALTPSAGRPGRPSSGPARSC